jgi:hypothetical protein
MKIRIPYNTCCLIIEQEPEGLTLTIPDNFSILVDTKLFTYRLSESDSILMAELVLSSKKLLNTKKGDSNAAQNSGNRQG